MVRDSRSYNPKQQQQQQTITKPQNQSKPKQHTFEEPKFPIPGILKTQKIVTVIKEGDKKDSTIINYKIILLIVMIPVELVVVLQLFLECP